MEAAGLDRMESPLGELLLAVDSEGRLLGLGWGDREPRLWRDLNRCRRAGYRLYPERSAAVKDALRAYFDGDLAAIEGVEIDPGGTPFQRRVWSSLRALPVGRPLTYGELAAHLGRPSAMRAVGHANGANPISIVIPCHRLIGAGGTLTGYGGGLERKRWLLEHEGAQGWGS